MSGIPTIGRDKLPIMDFSEGSSNFVERPEWLIIQDLERKAALDASKSEKGVRVAGGETKCARNDPERSNVNT